MRVVGFYFGLLIALFLVCKAGRAATLVWDPNPAHEAVSYYTVSIQPAPEGFLPTKVFTNRFPLALPAGVNFTLSVTATSAGGESLPSSISYFLPIAPGITLQPASKVIAAGDSLELFVEVSGTPPFDFQWMRGATVLPSETNQTLVIDSVTIADLGNYSVRVSNPAGSVESSSALVTVLTRPAIIVQPLVQAITLGLPFQIGVVATGSDPLGYQWYRDGQPIPGAQSATYAVLSATVLHAGNYFARVTNLVGSAQSDSVVVSLPSPPLIIAQPKDIDVLIGTSFALAVDVRGAFPFGYQWFRNGAPLAAANESSLNVSLATAADAGDYYAVVTNQFGSVQSASATIGVIPHIVIKRHPADANVALGSNLTLVVEATSPLPLTYQWFRDDLELETQTSAVLQIANVTNTHGGAYHALVRNALEEMASDPAQVKIVSDPAVSAARLSVSLSGGAIVLVGQGLAGVTYEVQLSDSLTTPAWNSIQPVVVADANGQFRVQIPSGERQQFIRTVRQ